MKQTVIDKYYGIEYPMNGKIHHMLMFKRMVLDEDFYWERSKKNPDKFYRFTVSMVLSRVIESLETEHGLIEIKRKEVQNGGAVRLTLRVKPEYYDYFTFVIL